MRYFSRSHNRSRNLRPPDLYEYYVDNYWFKSVTLENQKINEPLRGSHNADIVIVGGGFTLRVNFIKRKITEYGVDCDLEENGMLEVAFNNKHVRGLEEFHGYLKSFDLESTLLQGDELDTEIKSPRFIAGLKNPLGFFQ